MTTTYIVEWDVDNIYSLIVAEDDLRRKANDLRRSILSIAEDELLNEDEDY